MRHSSRSGWRVLGVLHDDVAQRGQRVFGGDVRPACHRVAVLAVPEALEGEEVGRLIAGGVLMVGRRQGRDVEQAAA